MNWLNNLNTSLQFIEDNIMENITCEDVSKMAFSSHHHFLRMFFILGGINLGEYIRNRRLTLAASDIVSSDERIIDVAFKYQYNTAESFSKAFKRFHGVTPSEAKRKQPLLKSQPKLSFQVTLKGDQIMDYKIVKKDNLVFKGLVQEMTTIDGANFKEIPKMWDKVMSSDICDIMFSQMDELGVVGLCYDWKEEDQKFKYMIGVRNESAEIDNSEVARFDSQTFAAFKSVGKLPKALQNTISQVFREWFPSSNYEHSGGPELEIYPPGNPQDDDYVCYFWVPIKQKGE